MQTFVLGQVIASRSLRYQPRSGEAVDLTVTVGIPTRAPDGRAWICPFQITGIGDEPVKAIFGADAMQALILALHILPTELQVIARSESGGFPNNDEYLGLSNACGALLTQGRDS